MKINIINLDKTGWILTKFAKKMFINLKLMNINCYLSRKPREDVDINHSIIFLFLKNKNILFPKQTVNTTMLTHVNDQFRFDKVKSISHHLDAGIAMSEHHMNYIKNKNLGIKKLFSVLPPHDNDMNFKKIHLGIFSNLYTDGRKNEVFFEKIFCNLNYKFFKISIIGKGWTKIVQKLRQKNIEVKYYSHFFRTIYIHELKKIDYLLYLGNDEGSMTFMDAIQLGIKTIMIPQGFQYDLKKLITHPLKKDLSNLNSIIKKLSKEKIKFIEYKNKLTWENYVKEHLKIWKYLKKMKKN